MVIFGYDTQGGRIRVVRLCVCIFQNGIKYPLNDSHEGIFVCLSVSRLSATTSYSDYLFMCPSMCGYKLTTYPVLQCLAFELEVVGYLLFVLKGGQSVYIEL